ncbi:MAG: hypothetical protein LBR68_01115, partial [Lachnoclostridium sp.]|nr:hypothetical protein [Lachnoclostridium sp.]
KDRTIIRGITCFAAERIEIVFSIIDEIENETIQAYAASDALRFVKDHKHPLVLKWYRKLDEMMNDYDRFSFLGKALTDNVPFVCEEIGRIFEKQLVDGVKRCNSR